MVSILQRLNFYIGRSRQLTMAEIDLEMSRLRREFRIPSSFDVEEEASAILSEIVADSDAISRAIVQQSEWVRLDEHTSLSEFTTLLKEQQRKDSECPICREGKDLAAITIACKHIFCEECLGVWACADQHNSHLCPSCRQELFPKPTYTVLPPASVQYPRGISGDMPALDQEVRRAARKLSSPLYFNEEVKLQLRFERATRSPDDRQ